jgi:SAM-dependent methyltransferase
VLDVGCGTGIWSIEFADEHPSAHVLGTDLSPIQPEEVPPNCEFLIDDCTKDWIFHDQFDFIHTRALVAAIKDWSQLLEQAHANLKPGGFIECQELTFPIKCMDPGVTAENSPLMRWSQLFFEGANKIGLDATGPRHLAPRFHDAGFTDVNLKSYKWPLGTWAKGSKFKLLGRLVYEDLWDGLPSLSLNLFTRSLQWSREEVEVLLAECRQESKRKDRHYYIDAYVKPPATSRFDMLIRLVSSGTRRSPRTPARYQLHKIMFKRRNFLNPMKRSQHNDSKSQRPDHQQCIFTWNCG